MGRWSVTSLFRLKMCDSLSTQKARYSLVAPCSITAKICKRAASKSLIPTRSRTAPVAKVSLFDFALGLSSVILSEAKNLWLFDRSRESDVLEMFRLAQHDRFGTEKCCMSQGARAELHLHHLSFFVLEVVIDGFHEAVGKLLHFALHVVQLILAQSAGRLKLLRLVDGSVPIGTDAHPSFLGHFAKGTD